MGTAMKRILACLSLLLLIAPVTFVRGPAPPPDDSQYITVTSIGFDSSDPERTRTGSLEFIGGWKLESDNGSFGGVSAMLAFPDNRFLMLSDAGVLIGFTLDEDKHQAIRPFIAPLPDGPPKPNAYAKKNWDAESLAHDPANGRFWVGFEHQHGIWRYGRSFARKESLHKVPEMQDWPNNGGAEAMLRLTDGRFLVFSESAAFKSGDATQALIFAGDPVKPDAEPGLFGYRPPKGYNITDAALLPGGHALLLHRRFRPLEGVSAIISIGDLSEIGKGTVWTARPVATLKSPLAVDNMEALAVTEQEGHRIVWIASDDNYNGLQETILLKFRLLDGDWDKPDEAERGDNKKPANEKTGAGPGFSSLNN